VENAAVAILVPQQLEKLEVPPPKHHQLRVFVEANDPTD
jgi:hypothetical protein